MSVLVLVRMRGKTDRLLEASERLAEVFGMPDGLRAQATAPTQLKYQWQVRHRWKPWLHFGAQGFGELGPWDRWSPHDAQSHRAGPALFGSIDAGPGVIGWQAAYLLGKTFGQRGDMFTLRLKYDF